MQKIIAAITKMLSHISLYGHNAISVNRLEIKHFWDYPPQRRRLWC